MKKEKFSSFLADFWSELDAAAVQLQQQQQTQKYSKIVDNQSGKCLPSLVHLAVLLATLLDGANPQIYSSTSGQFDCA